ncbi:MAG: AAA family ATPase [Microthrixaceae bacterium]
MSDSALPPDTESVGGQQVPASGQSHSYIPTPEDVVGGSNTGTDGEISSGRPHVSKTLASDVDNPASEANASDHLTLGNQTETETVAEYGEPTETRSSETPATTEQVVAGPSSENAPQGERVKRSLPRVMAVANQKGGVGKTTTTVNLGAALAELDYRVLVVDLDPQGNATTGLGVDHRSLDYTVYDVLLNDVMADECIEPTDLKGLFLLAANLNLAGAEVELVNQMSRETRLKRALDEVIDQFDYVLIDCPPSLGLLTINALVAATEVIVPIQCEYYALEGLGQLTHNVELVRKNLNPALEVSTIVLVMYDSRTRLSEQVAAEVRAHFGPKVCRNVIPRNIRLSEAPSYGQPITVFDSSSRGSVAYRELAREVSDGT